ncbi:MAG: FecR domain-containing protein [Verrucomicrobia bacterium]|nr:FecR domain-containing protein [Verrucomicrobiota bacterium]
MISFLKHLGMVSLAFLPILSSAALQTGKVQVGKISGNVTIIDAKSQRKPLTTGAVFQEGARVETGVDSTAELVFSNGASLVLTPSTLLELRTFRQVPSAGITDPYRQIEKDPSPSVTEVEVPRGKIIGEVRKLNALSTFTVKTPAGLVRIRGTVFAVEYRVGPDGVGKVVVSCVRGSVETVVYSSNAGPVTVDPGMQTASSVPSAALISNLARAVGAPAGAPAPVPAPAVVAAAVAPVKVLLFPIPAEELAEISATLVAASTLPAEVSSTINAMAQTAPTLAAIFPNGATEPAKAFGQVITDSQVTDVKVAESKAGAPGAPLSSSNGGGGTTMDENLKKITDNVNRSVEQKQLDPSGTGG